MSAVPFEHIVAKRGTAEVRLVSLYGATGGPLDLTAAVVNFRIWEEGTTVDLFGPVALQIIAPATLGKVALAMSSAQVDQLPVDKKLWYDVIIVNGPAMVQGRFYLEPNRVR